jgi:hypothetical protein
VVWLPLLGTYDAARPENRMAAPPAASGTAPRIIPADANCAAVGRTMLEPRWIISERLKDTFVRIHRSAWNSDPKQKLQKNKTIQKSDLHDSI